MQVTVALQLSTPGSVKVTVVVEQSAAPPATGNSFNNASCTALCAAKLARVPPTFATVALLELLNKPNKAEASKLITTIINIATTSALPRCRAGLVCLLSGQINNGHPMMHR